MKNLFQWFKARPAPASPTHKHTHACRSDLELARLHACTQAVNSGKFTDFSGSACSARVSATVS